MGGGPPGAGGDGGNGGGRGGHGSVGGGDSGCGGLGAVIKLYVDIMPPAQFGIQPGSVSEVHA